LVTLPTPSTPSAPLLITPDRPTRPASQPAPPSVRPSVRRSDRRLLTPHAATDLQQPTDVHQCIISFRNFFRFPFPSSANHSSADDSAARVRRQANHCRSAQCGQARARVGTRTSATYCTLSIRELNERLDRLSTSTCRCCLGNFRRSLISTRLPCVAMKCVSSESAGISLSLSPSLCCMMGMTVYRGKQRTSPSCSNDG